MRGGTAIGSAVLALVVAAPSWAHHSVGVFETSTPIRVKGVVVRFNWSNPHSAIVIEQVAEDGRKVRWALESSAPIRLLESRGFSKDSFKPGDLIEACGYEPKADHMPPLGSSAGRYSGPEWLLGADRVITARVLSTKDGRTTEWSHYGPVDRCLGEQSFEGAPEPRAPH